MNIKLEGIFCVKSKLIKGMANFSLNVLRTKIQTNHLKRKNLITFAKSKIFFKIFYGEC